MPQLVTFSCKDDPYGTPCFGRLDGDAITDLTDTFKGRFSSLSDAANASGAKRSPLLKFTLKVVKVVKTWPRQ